MMARRLHPTQSQMLVMVAHCAAEDWAVVFYSTCPNIHTAQVVKPSRLTRIGWHQCSAGHLDLFDGFEYFRGPADKPYVYRADLENKVDTDSFQRHGAVLECSLEAWASRRKILMEAFV